jgi:alpha-glucosidase
MIPSNAWWQGAVIYQIYPRSFFDTNGDGIGDLPGIIAKLDYIAGLGVDAIWLSPFFTSPMDDFGYDVADYRDVDSIMGTLADFDTLLAKAHRLGLKVLIDQVWAHSSDQHPWFKASRRRDGRHDDWYVWADPRADGTPPNNWLSVFGGAAWRWEPQRRQYFLHPFLPSQPKLDLGNPAVLDAVLAAGAFWLDRGVDGFRLDAVDFLRHDSELRDNPAAMPSDGLIPTKLFGLQQHIHDMAAKAAVLPVLGRIRELTDRYPGTTTLAEVSSQVGAYDRIDAYTGPGRLHLAYTLRLLRETFSAGLFAEAFDHAQAALAGGSLCWAFSNHDVARAVTRWLPADGAGHVEDFQLLLTALLISLPGTICLFQGEELGLSDVALDEDQLRDPFGLTYWPEFNGRDGSRTPMPWRAAERHAGFTTAAEPWLPVPDDHRVRSVDVQEEDPRSVLQRTRSLLFWRRDQPALRRGRLGQVMQQGDILAFERIGEDGRVIAVFNLSGRPGVLSLDLYRSVEPLPGHGFDGIFARGAVRLPPFGVFFAAVEPLPELERS